MCKKILEHNKIKFVRLLSLLFAVVATTIPAMANDEGGTSFDPKEVLFEHVLDAYEWHVTEGVVMPLPVIVYGTEGLQMFLSNEFEHHADADGYRKGPGNLAIATVGDNEGKIVELINGEEIVPFDISITKTVCVLFINMIILLCCVLIPARWCKRHKPSDEVPKGFTGLMEMFIMFVVDDIIKPCVGKGYEKYTTYLLTCFFFIFACNVMGVIPFPPGGGNLTGNIACTFFLALCTFVIVQFSGSKHYWKEIYNPDVPGWLKPIMGLIEFIGIFTKPFALMIRLFANMLAGHIIAVSITLIIFLMAEQGIVLLCGMSLVSVLMSTFMMLLECLVCFIQAMVFTMLSSVFIGLARENPEHH